MSVFIGYPSFMAYQMMKGKKGNNDGFPSIPGMIARYSALGLTNEQMAENPVWVDKTGNGHDIQLKNFSWGGMSGVGGYKFNFKNSSEWNISVVQVKEHNDNRIVINNRLNAVQLSYKGTSIKIVIKLTGVEENNSRLKIYDDIDSSKEQSYNKDGIYEIDYIANDGANYVYFYITGGNYGELDLPITIEQLPLYPGFILGDGVDDFAVTEKELNFEDTYTVYTAFIPFQDDPARTMSLCGKDRLKDFYMYYSSLDSIGFFSVDKAVSTLLSKGFNLIVCKKTSDKMLIKNLIMGKVAEVSVDDLIYNPGLYYLWRSATIANYSKTAIAGQVICNGHFTTDEEDEKVLNWHKKQYPWLFPNQAWTVTGKTNEDEDRATIANITGNGNNLVLSNFGFAEGSGYNEEGEYAGYLVTDGVDDKITSSTFEMGNDWTVIGDWELINTGKNDNADIVKFNSIVIYNYNPILINIKNGRNNLIPDQNTVNAICSDGRIYSKDWKESIYNEETESTSKNLLTIGYSGNDYTKIAFRNLAIYPTVLSKEDCIKAYNYLQTLKAK